MITIKQQDAMRTGSSSDAKTQRPKTGISDDRETVGPCTKAELSVALLTGGSDKPYALGLAWALSAQGISVDFIGSDELDVPELRRTPALNYLNLRGDQRAGASFFKKVTRILTYYGRLLCYAAMARPKVFHILWNNKFEFLDRSLLMLYYRLLGKRIAFTAHNVNARKRDSNDSFLNRLSLSIQYRLADHIFVHTPKMKAELINEFTVANDKVSVIPLGFNNSVPVSKLSTLEARKRLNLAEGEKVLLFFGRIAPYKGLEYLIAALGEVVKKCDGCRLVIAGSVKDCAEYWQAVQQQISTSAVRERILERIEFIPDEETELYFKAADVLVLPYVEIFQSGVLVLAYSFGLPVIAADVGSLREDIVEGTTGYVFQPRDSADLARKIEVYFSSDLFRGLEHRRQEIRDYANDRYSWTKVGEITKQVYEALEKS